MTYNPYWSILRGAGSPLKDPMSIQRNYLCRKYTWCIPDPASLSFVARQSGGKIVEIGAGRGYWAWQLSKRGVDVVAYDIRPVQLEENNSWHTKLCSPRDGSWSLNKKSYFNVKRGNAEVVAKHPKRTLMLCWPPYGHDMAYNALRQYRGDRLIYLGEMNGCCANDKFFGLLRTGWTMVAHHQCVRWRYINDAIWVFERRLKNETDPPK